MPVRIFPVGCFPAPIDSPDVTVACPVVAAAAVAASLPEISALRDQPGGPGAPPLPPRFLRHSDEQSVVGLAAVLRALESPALRGVRFDDWGVVAAPVFPGRLGSADTFTKYRQNGAAVVSPHTIPQYSLHSVAGAISICLGIHGLNFGVGGGWQALAEGLTVALSLVGQGPVAGLWLVFTQWMPEPVPDGRGSMQSPSVCAGTALALRPGAASATALQLTMPGSRPPAQAPPTALDAAVSPHAPPASRHAAFVEFTRALTADLPGRPAVAWSLSLPWGGRVELLRTQYQQQTKAA
jgi:hypothetical protein